MPRYAYAAAQGQEICVGVVTAEDEFTAEWDALEEINTYFNLNVECLDEIMLPFNIVEITP